MNDFKTKIHQSLGSKLEKTKSNSNSNSQKPPPIVVPKLFSISSAKFNLKPTNFTKKQPSPSSSSPSVLLKPSSTIFNQNKTSSTSQSTISHKKNNIDENVQSNDQSSIESEYQSTKSLKFENECKINTTNDQILLSASDSSAQHHSIMNSNSISPDLPENDQQTEGEVEEQLREETERVEEEQEKEHERAEAEEEQVLDREQGTEKVDEEQVSDREQEPNEEQDRVREQEAEEAQEAEDRVQDWQTQFHQNPTALHKEPIPSTSENRTLLERANSAAARLDSLARLNGVKTPTSTEGHPDDQDSDDELPPFLRHLEEIQKKQSQDPTLNQLSLHQTLHPASAYPLLPPTGLGFTVGPNGRGVPRLSALQRKALEKMEKMEKRNGIDSNQPVIGKQTPLGGATLLSRSHTTTGTERTRRLDISALQGRNKGLQRSQTPNDLPEDLSTYPTACTEREQARSNLIRKLSSRSGAGPGRQTKPKAIPSELTNSLVTPAIPVQDQDSFQLPYLSSKPRPRSGSTNDLAILTGTEGISRMEAKDLDLGLSIHLHDPQQITFEPDNTKPDLAGLVISGQHSTPESQSAASIEKVNEINPIDEPVLEQSTGSNNGLENTTSLQKLTRSSSIHTTTTNRASSSELSNFTLNSEFRSYRHSVERDRDSVLDRMGLIDNTLDNEINGHLVSDSAEQLPYEAMPELPCLGGSFSDNIGTDNSQQTEGDTKNGNGEEKRVVTSLPPFNSMLNYDEDQLCSVSTLSTLCPPQKPSLCMEPIVTSNFQHGPINSSKPQVNCMNKSIPTSSTSTFRPTGLVVHQTTTTTISSSVGDDEAFPDSSLHSRIHDGFVSSPHEQQYVTVKGSGSYFDDIIFSPAPDLPETILKYDENCLADYKFPSSAAIRRTSLRTLKENGEGNEEDERVVSVDEPTMMIEESSCNRSPVAITSSSPWRESKSCSPRSTDFSSNAHKPVTQTMTDTTYQDQVNRALEEMSRGSTASSLSNRVSSSERPSSHSPVMPIKRRLSPTQPLNPIERPRPRRPSNPPPIAQPHHTLCRSPPPPPTPKSHMHSLGPSQFPPAPHSAKSHMPSASAQDLARYNDSKLAPFPALLSSSYATSPPLGPSQTITSNNSSPNVGSLSSTPTLTSASSMSPGFSDSSLKSISGGSQPSHSTKPSRSHGNSILSTASSFISSSLGHHGRASSTSSSISTSLIGQPVLVDSSRPNFGNCTKAGQAAHMMSPSLSQTGFNFDPFDEAEEHVEEIDQRASGPIDNHDSPSGPPYRQNSVSARIKRSSAKATSTSSSIPESSSAHPLLPQSSLMSRSSVSHSSLSSYRSSSSDHRQQILQKLGPFLNFSDLTKPNLSRRPSMLNQPPRKLRLHGPVLQVVNSTSVKDRYLFLFTDILVITKPIIEFETNLSPEGERIPKLPITLNQSFLTKSVVELSKLECVRPRIDTKAINGNVELKEPTSLTTDTKPSSSKSNSLLIQQFIGQFAIDPQQTIFDAIQRGVIKEDAVSIAKVLFMTTELDKKQIGLYLSRTENVKVLKSFIDRFKFHHCRIDDALRVFMLSIRLPNDLQAVEVLLATFASQWSAVNQAIGISQPLALRLIKALFGLNDALHTSLHDSTKYVTNAFSLPHGAAHSPQHFIEFFKAENQLNQSYSRRSMESSEEEFEPEKMISDEKLDLLLNKVYVSVARDKIVQAKATEDETETILVTNSIAESDPEGGGAMNTFPNRLTYMIGSDQITFTIPEIDSHFGIKLFSTGLKFEPPFLTFSKSRSASFKIIGRSLGICHITFIKIGSRASKYVGLPYSKPVLVERAFMKDTLQISFMNHLKTKRKYLFSFESLESRESFLEVMEFSQLQLKGQNEKLERERKEGKKEEEVAELAALQVLRDTLIPNEDFMPLTVNPHTHTTISLKSSKPHSKSTNPNSQSTSQSNEEKSKQSEEKKPSRIRSNSLSETYIYQTGSQEKDLQSIIVNKRMIAQQLHIKKKQQKLLQIHLRSNIEGGKLGLNPYSISLANHKQSGHHLPGVAGAGGTEEKDEVEVYFEKFWMKGDELIHQCQQNSLIPLVLRFLSQGVIIEKK